VGGRIVNDFQVVIQDAYVRFRNTFTEELFIQTEMDDEFGLAKPEHPEMSVSRDWADDPKGEFYRLNLPKL